MSIRLTFLALACLPALALAQTAPPCVSTICGPAPVPLATQQAQAQNWQHAQSIYQQTQAPLAQEQQSFNQFEQQQAQQNQAWAEQQQANTQWQEMMNAEPAAPTWLPGDSGAVLGYAIGAAMGRAHAAHVQRATLARVRAQSGWNDSERDALNAYQRDLRADRAQWSSLVAAMTAGRSDPYAVQAQRLAQLQALLHAEEVTEQDVLNLQPLEAAYIKELASAAQAAAQGN